MCSTKLEDGVFAKALIPLCFKAGLGHMSSNFTEDPFLLMGMAPKTSKASWAIDSDESSITGISALNLGCFCLFIFPVNCLGLLIGFCKVVARLVLAWRMASCFEDGGLGEEEAREN